VPRAVTGNFQRAIAMSTQRKILPDLVNEAEARSSGIHDNDHHGSAITG